MSIPRNLAELVALSSFARTCALAKRAPVIAGPLPASLERARHVQLDA
jgi:hypothetical protein